MIYILIFWLTGCVVAYLALKRSFKDGIDEWTIGDRNVCLIMSIFSWIAVLVAIVVPLFFENDKPAKW